MAGFVEGIGDEVIWFLIAVIVIVLISLAWISTGIPPVDYYVWLVQMQIHPSRRIVQVLQVDNQEANLFRDHPERRPFGAVTEQALEALMDSGIMEQSNTSQEVVLPQAVEIAQVQTSEGSSLHTVEVPQNTEQAISLAENRESLLHGTCIETETGNWQQSSGVSSSSSAENGRNSLTDTKLSSTVVSQCLNDVCAKAKISDSAFQRATVIEENYAEQQISNVKLKFLDDSQVIACTALESTVGQFKRKIYFKKYCNREYFKIMSDLGNAFRIRTRIEICNDIFIT